MRLSSNEVRVAYHCVATVIRARRQDISRPVSDLFDRLEAEFHRMLSPERHGTDTGASDPESSRIGAGQAAELLGLSTRTIQRNANALRGELVSGTWVFDRDTVLEYSERRRSA
jgi:hypothetical protein